MKKVTSQDVAQRAGVSQSAVSLILNNNEKISFSEETRSRVFQAAKELGYSLPQRRVGKSSSARTLLLLTPTLTNEYYTEIIQAVEEYANQLRYRVIMCNTFRKPDLEKYYLDTFAKEGVDGIIYAFLPSFPDVVEQLSVSIPTVIIGEKRSSFSVCSIELSNITAGRLLVEHLYKLGHRHLEFISTPFNQVSMAREQRLQGIREQLAQYGIEDGLEVLVAEKQSEADHDENGMPFEYNVGRRLTAQLLARNCSATAFIGVNDMTALGILNELAAQGVRVPQDISVCGFDNIFSSRVCSPDLTTIDHHLRARCHQAVDLVVRQDASQLHSPYVNKIEYTPNLIIRSSTGPVREV